MNPESGKQWERFLEYAALARAKPTFDAEEREWKLSVADRVREVLRAAGDGAEWLPLLNSIYRRGDLARFVASRPQRDWLNAWAAADPESARRALAAFLDPAPDAEERIRSFARVLEPDEAKEKDPVETTAALTLGSVCNFAMDPLSLPMMRPGVFGRLEQILGYARSGSDGIVDQYADHLGFARWVHSRMEQSGFRVRDMIDVQSLILIAVRERDFWTGDRLCAIGVPPPPTERAAPRDEALAARHYLSICAGYRNEAPYLQEWIEFHRLAGVEHFFLYDAHSTDNHEEVLAPYVEGGIVTTHDWEGISHDQADTYNECLREHRGDSRWIAFIDCDEFLFSPTGRSLPEVLVDYEGWPGVGVNRPFFGSSGHVTKPPGLVIENYLMRVITPDNTYIKCIVDPLRVTNCPTAHQFVYDSLLTVDENHYPIHGTNTKSISWSRLRINHYVTKSDEEARAKLGRPKEWTDSRLWRSNRFEDSLPQELDRTITSYLPALRAALAGGPSPAAPSQPARPT